MEINTNSHLSGEDRRRHEHPGHPLRLSGHEHVGHRHVRPELVSRLGSDHQQDGRRHQRPLHRHAVAERHKLRFKTLNRDKSVGWRVGEGSGCEAVTCCDAFSESGIFKCLFLGL